MTGTAIVLGMASFYGAWSAYNSKLGIDNATTLSATVVRVGSLEAAIGDISIMKDQMRKVETATAVQGALLEALSRDRFQYDPGPSQIRVLQSIATSTP